MCHLYPQRMSDRHTNRNKHIYTMYKYAVWRKKQKRTDTGKDKSFTEYK